MHASDPYVSPTVPASQRIGFWQKLGGTPLMVAVVVHLIALIIGAVWIFQVIQIPEKDPEIPQGCAGNPSKRESSNSRRMNKMAHSTQLRKVMVNDPHAAVLLPDLALESAEFSPLESPAGRNGHGSLGDGNGLGDGSINGQSGPGNGHLGLHGLGDRPMFQMVPLHIGKRCSRDDRMQRLQAWGGTPMCEEAVVKGLRWLKANQKPDGSFADGPYKVAMTGLGLLAYFGHCETPVSEEFGDSCTRAIVFLVNLAMKNDGRMATNAAEHAWCYEHAIATYALGEAYTFCRQIEKEQGYKIPNLAEMTEKAGQFIIDHQHQSGGWAYAYALDGGHVDTSVTGWQVQALKACSHTLIKYRGMNGCINRALRYVNGCQDKSGGYGYVNTQPAGGVSYHTLTGVGMLCNQMWDKGNRAEVSKAAKYVKENTRFDYNGEDCDLYGHYYESQAMMQRGGADWKQYNQLFRDQILNNQNADGSWKPPGGGKKPRAIAPSFVGDPVYRTCLCTLMLEVYYRFLNTNGGGAVRDPL